MLKQKISEAKRIEKVLAKACYNDWRGMLKSVRVAGDGLCVHTALFFGEAAIAMANEGYFVSGVSRAHGNHNNRELFYRVFFRRINLAHMVDLAAMRAGMQKEPTVKPEVKIDNSRGF